ncbi:hypothetical protein CBM2633_P280003 [Cupriavidus taiwanensis]|uniref:Uncharacterized protein n=2 Tax=Cupriavidus TaxID=106589 RepID=A0A375DB04_9BURK|nr:hypothetical protein CBM2585_P280004 [Cupriavidus taiwanensis]SOZ40559.1 hypothetical protein CBM2605_P280003 [Cupriavidus neocaledonicus]SOY75715.1 hypothetical protein CBM2588_P310003 [Cupriavidus taiwanensis]SOY75784.1 hypothetical protein CBM2592_P310003 [Cupriavidus taiwanensis]SOY76192.1 hypothetical protein CBM2589_P290003 [Cupriavidus taiwanensis]
MLDIEVQEEPPHHRIAPTISLSADAENLLMLPVHGLIFIAHLPGSLDRSSQVQKTGQIADFHLRLWRVSPTKRFFEVCYSAHWQRPESLECSNGPGQPLDPFVTGRLLSSGVRADLYNLAPWR